MKKKKLSNIMFTIGIMISLAVIGYAGYKLYDINKEHEEVKNTYDDVIKVYVKSNVQDDQSDGSDQEYDTFEVNWEELKKANQDIIAWIRIPDTNINYPIVQGQDNQKYVRHNIYGNYSIGGCIFVDSEINKPFKNANTIIYGHNLSNGTMFSNIEKYADIEYFLNHRIIYLYLPNETVKTYKIFAFSKIKEDNSEIYNTNVDNLEDYYRVIKKYNQLNIQENLDTSNPILTLSTCTNHNKSERYIVQAYCEQ